MYLHFSNTFYSLFYYFALIVDFKAETNNKAYQGALSNRKHSELIETDFNGHMISFPLTQKKIEEKIDAY